MSELLDTARKYTREYIRLRKETNRLLREGKIDKRDAGHRNGSAKQFLLFARFQLQNAKNTSNLKTSDMSPPHNWRLDAKDKWPRKSGDLVGPPPIGRSATEAIFDRPIEEF